MPGLNQLKQFSEDIREIGDEVNIRAQRGEKPVSLPLPQGISEEDDSEELLPAPHPVSRENARNVVMRRAAAFFNRLLFNVFPPFSIR